MAPRKPPTDEIPELKARGLYASKITGDGNCLFNALSDQLHGDESQNKLYRTETTQYMEENPHLFKPFITPAGERRSKRKNRGALTSSNVIKEVTEDEIEIAFKNHLKEMAKGGSFGGQLELTAFANAFGVEVVCFSTHSHIFNYHRCDDRSGGAVPKIYIVFHDDYQHYSSIRNIDGPHQGLPLVKYEDASSRVEDEQSKYKWALSWQVDAIQHSLPYSASRESVFYALEAYKGNMTRAISALMPASSGSSSRSSSIERESDGEIDETPTKKFSRHAVRPKPLHLGDSNKDFSDNTNSSKSISPDPSQLSSALSKLIGDGNVDPDETEEEDWRPGCPHKDSGTASKNTSPSVSSASIKGPRGRPVRVKLSQPKKPSDKPQSAKSDSSKGADGGEYDADREKSPSRKIATKPRRRLIRGFERDRMRAERAKRASPRTSLSPTSANIKQSDHTPPVVGAEINVLKVEFSQVD